VGVSQDTSRPLVAELLHAWCSGT